MVSQTVISFTDQANATQVTELSTGCLNHCVVKRSKQQIDNQTHVLRRGEQTSGRLGGCAALLGTFHPTSNPALFCRFAGRHRVRTQSASGVREREATRDRDVDAHHRALHRPHPGRVHHAHDEGAYVVRSGCVTRLAGAVGWRKGNECGLTGLF